MLLMLKTNEKVEKKCMFVVSYMVRLAVENACYSAGAAAEDNTNFRGCQRK